MLESPQGRSNSFAFVHGEMDGKHVLHVFGELDLSNAKEFETAIAAAGDALPLVIDLSPCTYIDSSILAVISRVHKQRGMRLFLLVPETGVIRRVLQVTGMTEVLQLL